MDTADQLIKKLQAIDPNANAKAVQLAYDYAERMHAPQKRASGEPYFMHPVAVANILIEMRMDWQSVVTALLHDTVEDTDATLPEVEKLFGKNIALLVNGVTKLGQVELSGDGSSSAENFRKLFLAMAEDIRVLLVKLADRMHNMRTLQHIKKPDKRLRKSRETLEIYAPLAERMGMERVKEELQDLAFCHINPDARTSINQRVAQITDADDGLAHKIISELDGKLKKNGIVATITGRVKSSYSIWNKMQSKSIDFEQLSDIMAFRVVTKDIPDCYAVLGLLHAEYAMVPGRFKDYISLPKKNGYRSIHTGIVGPEKRKIEVQIRDEEMHETNEHGLAAHWAYKQGEERSVQSQNDKKAAQGTDPYEWLRELREVLEHAASPDEFLEHTKMEMFRDQVFVFTPRGRLIGLPAGATPVDFAYEVHTGVGNKCTGAKINGRIRPLQTVLQNGDQVDVITAKNANPSPDWLNFVVSGKARAQLRKFKRSTEREQYVELGRKLISEAFKSEELDYADKALVPALKKLKKQEPEDVLQDLGAGFLTTREILHAIFPNFKPKQKQSQRKDTPDQHFAKDNVITFAAGQAKKSKPNKGLPIKGLIPGLALHYARCCHPLRGDRIVGITTTGKGVTIHTLDCITLEQFQDQPERWLSVSWEGDDEEAAAEALTGRMAITITNEPGSLAAVTAVIGKHDGNISNLRFVNRSNDFFEVLVDVEVQDSTDLSMIMGALRANKHIAEVSRARG